MKQYTTFHAEYGTVTYNNELESFIKTTFKQLKDRKEQKYFGFDRKEHLTQFRTLWSLRPRQTGTTDSIAAMFNTKTDLYVAAKWPMVDEFCGKFNFIQNKPKNKVRYALLNRPDLNSIRGNSSNIKRVFIDVGGPYCMNHPDIIKKIKIIIENLEKVVSEDTVYIIT